MYFLMELVSGGELLDALDSIGLLKYSQAGFLREDAMEMSMDHRPKNSGIWGGWVSYG